MCFMLEMLFWADFVVYSMCVCSSFPCPFQALDSLFHSNDKAENELSLVMVGRAL